MSSQTIPSSSAEEVAEGKMVNEELIHFLSQDTSIPGEYTYFYQFG